MEISVILFFFSVLLIQAVWSYDVQNFTCLSCSGSDFTHEADLRCLNDTASITFFLHCNSSWPCSHREQINKKTGKVMSVLRGCEPTTLHDDCIYSNPNDDCFRFCYSDKCNNETNLWPEGPHGCSYNTVSGFTTTDKCNNETNLWPEGPHGCSYNTVSGFTTMAVPIIALIFAPQ